MALLFRLSRSGRSHTDPSYSGFLRYLATSHESSSTPIQKPQLDEVATLMLSIYQSLSEMRYLDPDSIQESPHDLSSIQLLHQSNNINLDPAILYLYSILPYIGEPSIGVTDFFHGVQRAKSFEAENGPYMRPWMTALSILGNHGSVLIYDAKLHRIWVIDQEGWEATDPGVEYDNRNGQAEKPTNRNSIEQFPGRPAGDLVELPGGGEYSGTGWNDDEIDLRNLHRQNGWPDAFDGEGFEVNKARAWFASAARHRANGPRVDMERLRQWREGITQDLEQHRRNIENAASIDEEWASRRQHKQNKIFARQCPGGTRAKDKDLVLREAELLRQEVRIRAEECRSPEPERARELEVEARVEETEARIYQKAYEAAVAETERLCPGKAFFDTVVELEKEVAEVIAWARRVPEEGLQTKAMVHEMIRDLEGRVKSEEILARVEGWRAKHGDEA
ncbi:hypothetical protein BDV10DRAFT_198496 [Aspergillus recurvatus]